MIIDSFLFACFSGSPGCTLLFAKKGRELMWTDMSCPSRKSLLSDAHAPLLAARLAFAVFGASPTVVL